MAGATLPETTSQSARRPAKEGWPGILLTAAVCGGILWWWFSPPAGDPWRGRDPRPWLEEARAAWAEGVPSLEIRLHVILISEAWRARGREADAAVVEQRWLPASWREEKESGVEPEEPLPSPPPDFPVEWTEPDEVSELPPLLQRPESPALAPVQSLLEEASAALDLLEIDHARSLQGRAAAAATALAKSDRDTARWLVLAAHTRSGFVEDATRLRGELGEAPDLSTLPAWLMAELLRADIIAPVLSWWRARTDDDHEALALLRYWRALARLQAHRREDTSLSKWGVAADASRNPGDDEPVPGNLARLRSLVETGDFATAARLVEQQPAGPHRATAAVELARLLVWRGREENALTERGGDQ